MDMCTLLYLKWITTKDLLYSTWNSAQCYMQPVWKGCLREHADMTVYAKSLHCSPETMTTSLIRFTPIQNKKLWEKHYPKCLWWCLAIFI